MLDENLPTFYLAESRDKIKHHATYYFARGGGEPEPAYSLNYADPSTPAAKNCYAIGLFDPYNPNILYGEVLVRPAWSQPTLSADEIRRNGGVPPPPEPLLPTEFTIQLYNPDQQIKVTSRTSSVLSSERFDFSMPQQTFRAPSASLLDRSENDPTADANIPKVNFTWKRESVLSKDLVCYLRGKSTDFYNKKKSKEPDITIALFRSLREVTVYESNLQRVETEDPKGLEVVLLLATATIRDIWFGNMRQVFNITDVGRQRASSAANQSQAAGVASPPSRLSPPARAPGAGGNAALGALYAQGPGPKPQSQGPAAAHQQQGAQEQQAQNQRRPTDPPPADPRIQWEIDAETARLKAQVEAEEREHRRAEEARRRERARLDEEETKRLRKMVEAEDRERQRRLKEAEKETKRLQKLYGAQAGGNAQPYTPAGPSKAAAAPQAPLRPQSTPGMPQYPQYPTPHPQASGALPPPQPPRPARSTSPHQALNSLSSSNGRTGYLGSMLDLAERQSSKLAKKKSSIW